ATPSLYVAIQAFSAIPINHNLYSRNPIGAEANRVLSFSRCIGEMRTVICCGVAEARFLK
ncbi:hypothetical protein HAX54_047627, partial [Datura stramonium]|nr:hypothetical protein [Datura stramonium]